MRLGRLQEDLLMLQQIDLLSEKLTVAEEKAERWERAAKVLACAFDSVEERRHAWRFIEDTETGR